MNRLLSALASYNDQCHGLMQETNVFPIELDLPQTTFQYAGASLPPAYHDDDEDEEEEDCDPLAVAEEALPESKDDDELLIPALDEGKVAKDFSSLNLLDD